MRSDRPKSTLQFRAMRVTGTVLGLAGAQMVVIGVAANVEAVQPAPLVISQQVGQAVAGKPFVITVSVTAPADRAAYGVEVQETVPGCAPLVAGSVQPPTVTVASMAGGPVAGGCPPGTLVFAHLGVLAAGATEQLSFALAAPDQVNQGLSFTAQGFASAIPGGAVTHDLEGAPIPDLASASLEMSTPATDAATVGAFGATEADSGSPQPTEQGSRAGLVTDTVSITQAAGLRPGAASVDVYLRSATPAACAPVPVTAPPAATPCLAPVVDTAALAPDLADPSLPARPLTTVAPGGPVAPVTFTHLRWTVTTTSDQPTTFSYRLLVPVPTIEGTAPEDLLVVSGIAVNDPTPPVPGTVDTPPTPVPVFSSTAAVHRFTWVRPTPPPPTTPTATTTLPPGTPMTPTTVPSSARTVLSAPQVVAGVLTASAGPQLVPAAAVTSTTVTTLQPLAATPSRNPFLAPGSTETVPTTTPVAGAAQPPTSVVATAGTAGAPALAQTGTNLVGEAGAAAGAVLAGAAVALASGFRRRVRYVGKHFARVVG